MPKIHLSRQHSLPPETLRAKVKAMEGTLRDKYRADPTWVDDSTVRVNGPGVKGQLKILADIVTIDLDLGFMLTPLKGKIEEGLSRELDKMVSPS